MFISSSQFNLDELSKDAIEYIFEKYSVAVFEDNLYIDILSDKDLTENTQSLNGLNLFKEVDGKIMFYEFNCFKDWEDAGESAKEYLEDWGDDLFSYFDNETIASWAKSEYALGASNFNDWVNNSTEDEDQICQTLSSYHGGEPDELFLSLDVFDDDDTVSCDTESNISDELFKGLAEGLGVSSDLLDKEMGNALGFLSNNYDIKNSNEEFVNCNIALTSFQQDLDKFVIQSSKSKKQGKTFSLKL